MDIGDEKTVVLPKLPETEKYTISNPLQAYF